jgi:hypothetical protein
MFCQSLILHASVWKFAVNKLVIGVFSPLVINENVDIVYWNLSYPLSILKVIFLESNPLQFIETLISFIRAYVYICPT